MAVTKNLNGAQLTKKSNQRIRIENLTLTYEQIIKDYRLAFKSRQVSLLGRKEVMGGKAKFGIFGDGKEVAQLAMAKAFQHGDFRSGYYRDQTFMFATGMSSLQGFFAQLYAHPDEKYDPATAGRAMNAHFATRSIDENGDWYDLTAMYNSSADISPTGSQMPRLVGLAYASRLYREIPELKNSPFFSKNGNEIAFGTIGNASCAEGMFWESINAIGVLKSPAIISIWDDGYGISVPNEFQITNENIADLLVGFSRKNKQSTGFEIFTAKGWDYLGLVKIYLKAAELARKEHVPCIIHVTEVTQPLGHSTSGSHERYKPKERLRWETDYDCISKMRQWLLENDIIYEGLLDSYEQEDTKTVYSIRDEAWQAFQKPIRAESSQLAACIDEIAQESAYADELRQIKRRLLSTRVAFRKFLVPAMRDVFLLVKDENIPAKQKLVQWKEKFKQENLDRFSSHLHSESKDSVTNVPEVKPVYSEKSKNLNGFELLNICFEKAFKRDPRVIAFGEDLGQLGGVNQGFRGMQKKFGALRISDTGIRECTIIGQAIGLALRGLRPIAEIQYLDYVLYALQIMSDDLANLHWRTKGGQKAPVIIRTRGHRFEGIWHSGSPMGAMIHLLRGMHVLVPRNMTQAAGFYNTLLKAEEPAILIEVLSGYRIKEKVPNNIGEFTLPLGVPEILRTGTDLTLVTYGATCRVAMEAAQHLEKSGVSTEIIDAQTLLPFDINGVIVKSLKKTNRIVFVDEDVPGGCTAYMMDEVLVKQDGYYWLDSKPLTITGKAHRPAFGSDGDYYSKPCADHIFSGVYQLMHESDPNKYPMFF